MTPKEKPWPRKCPNCRALAVTEAVEDYTATLAHDGRSYPITVPGLTITVCAACGNRGRSHESGERVVGALREAAGILKPEEIRARRLALGVSEARVAADLGVMAEVYERWERGGQLQTQGYDELLRAYFDVPALRDYFAARSGQRPPAAKVAGIAA